MLLGETNLVTYQDTVWSALVETTNGRWIYRGAQVRDRAAQRDDRVSRVIRFISSVDSREASTSVPSRRFRLRLAAHCVPRSLRAGRPPIYGRPPARGTVR